MVQTPPVTAPKRRSAHPSHRTTPSTAGRTHRTAKSTRRQPSSFDAASTRGAPSKALRQAFDLALAEVRAATPRNTITDVREPLVLRYGAAGEAVADFLGTTKTQTLYHPETFTYDEVGEYHLTRIRIDDVSLTGDGKIEVRFHKTVADYHGGWPAIAARVEPPAEESLSRSFTPAQFLKGDVPSELEPIARALRAASKN